MEPLDRASVPKVESQNDSAAKKEKTAAQKAIETQYSRDRQVRLRLKKQQEENRKGIRNALENFGSPDEETKAGAKRLLEARGISPDKIDLIYDLGVEAARQLKVPTNAFFWTNGAEKTLESVLAGEAQILELIENVQIEGELVRAADLYAIWDFGEARFADRMTFDGFKELRFKVKDDFFTLSKIEDKDFCEQPHRKFVDLMPKLDCKLLKPDYSQRDMQNFLAAASAGVRQRLLISSRNALKSSFVHLWCVQALLILPDLRLLLITETRPLSALFLKSLRSYLEVRGVPTKLQRLFPESCLQEGEGAATDLRMPNARLNLVQGTQASSMQSAGFAGSRFDFAVIDDPSSEASISSDAIKNTIDKYDSISKLADVKSLGTITIMTPWSETPPDLGAELIRRNDEDEEKFLLYHIEPAFEVKPSGAARFAANDLLQLEESDVTLTYPTRLTWAWCRQEMKNSRSNGFRFFRSQNLCQWLPPEGSELKCSFTEEMLKARTKPRSYYEEQRLPLIDTILAIDTAWSPAATACLSALAVIRFYKKGSGMTAVVEHLSMNRWRISELGIEIAEHIHRFSPSKVILEKTGPWESLLLEAKKACMLRSYIWPDNVYAKPTNLGNTPKAKQLRIKVLETMLGDEATLNFVLAPWNDDLFAQFIRFDGVTKNRKCDGPDAISIAIDTYFPKNGADLQKSEAMAAEEEAHRQAQNRAAMYHRIFSNAPTPVTPSPVTQEPRTLHGIPGIRFNEAAANPLAAPSRRRQMSFGDVMPGRKNLNS